MEKVITMTASHRPEYTARVVDSLSHCYGISNYKLIVHVEPVLQSVIDIFKNIKFCPVELHINERRLGHTLNAYRSLSRGFEESDYVIRIEDDTLLAKDFLKFHEFCYEKFKDEKENIFSICAGHYHEPDNIYSQEQLSSALLKASFSNQGWATWANRWFEPGGCHEVWEEPETITPTHYILNYKHRGWDWMIEEKHRRGRREVIPTISRVKNIGALNGVHTISPEHHEKHIKVKNWAEDFVLTEELEYHIIN